MKLLFTAMISFTFVLGFGIIGLTFFFGKMALAYAVRDRNL
jgi:hypothetical protein